MIGNLGVSISVLVQCKPLARACDKSISGRCLFAALLERFGFVQGSVNSATDLALAIYPATIIWNLNMRIAVNVSLILTMGLGVFTMVASILKKIYLKSLVGNFDISYQTLYLTIWFGLEIWFLVIAASIPTLRSLLSKRSNAATTIGSKSRRIFTGAAANHIELTDNPPVAGFDRTVLGSDSELARETECKAEV